MRFVKAAIALILLSLACSVISYGQTWNNNGLGNTVTNNYQKGGVGSDLLMIIPLDSNESIGSNIRKNGRIAVMNGLFTWYDSLNGKWQVAANSAASIDTTSLSNRINEKVSKMQYFGTIYNEGSWTISDSTNDFEVIGTASKVALSSGNWAFNSGDGTDGSRLNYLYYTGLTKIRETGYFVVGSKDATSYGFGISCGSVSYAGVRFDMTSGANSGKIFLVRAGVGDIATSSTAISFSVGDTIVLSFERSDFKFIGSVYNKNTAATTSVEFNVTEFLRYTQTTGVSQGNIKIINYGGTFTLDSIFVNSAQLKNAPVLGVGGASLLGIYAAYYQTGMISQINNNVFNFELNGGTSDIITNAIGRSAEIIALNPEQIILQEGAVEIHNCINGTPPDTTVLFNNYDSLVEIFTDAQRRVLHSVIPVSHMNDCRDSLTNYFFNHIRRTYGDSLIFTEAYWALERAGSTFYNHAEFPNQYGFDLLSSEMIKSCKINNVFYRENDDSVFYNGSGKFVFKGNNGNDPTLSANNMAIIRLNTNNRGNIIDAWTPTGVTADTILFYSQGIKYTDTNTFIPTKTFTNSNYWKMGGNDLSATGIFGTNSVNNIAFETSNTIRGFLGGASGQWIFGQAYDATANQTIVVFGANATEISHRNNATGNLSTDGFGLNLNNDLSYDLKNKENAGINFWTNNTNIANFSATGVLTTAALDNYGSDLSGSYVTRSKIDKGYADATYAPISGSANYEVPLTFSSPLLRTVNTISIPVATSGANGYLSSADWSTFNSKIGGSGTTNTVPLFTGTSTIGNSVITQVSSNIGIGIATALAKLHVAGNASTAIMVQSATTTPNPSFNTRSSRGTVGSETATQSGDVVGGFGFAGRGSTDWLFQTATISAIANQTFTDANGGTYLRFETTPDGSNARAEAMRIRGSKDVQFEGKFVEYGNATPAANEILVGDGTDMELTPISTAVAATIAYGNATLSGGTIAVANTAVTANSVVVCQYKTASGTQGFLTYTLNAGVGFTINSSSGTDASIVSYSVKY